MSNFTPGPWEVDEMACYVWGKDENGGPFTVAEIRGWAHLSSHHTDDEAIAIQTANAHLIAAAPEMLEVIHDLLEPAYERYQYVLETDTPDEAEVYKETIDQAEALLRRIEGEEAP